MKKGRERDIVSYNIKTKRQRDEKKNNREQ